jgi:hemerythrin-like domain-containing protein
MNPIQDLKNEHHAIEGALTILEQIAAGLGLNGTKKDARAMIDFLRTFADTCHHGKEERVLFPALEKIGVSSKGGPIGVMLAEHDLGRGHIRGMGQALDNLDKNIPEAVEQFEHHAKAYAKLLRQHIAKEDQVLFDIADRQLSQTAKDRIQQDFDRIETDIIGQGKHEAFHRMLDTLTLKYGTVK